MRVERIEIEGGGPVSGVLDFPADGVGLWLAKNDVAEAALVEAVAFALYGPPVGLRDEPAFSRVVLHLAKDDGTRISIDRSSAAGTASVIENGIPDVSADGVDLGWRCLALSREEFLAAAWVRYDDLRATAGDKRLIQLLSRVLEAPADSAEATLSPAAGAPPPQEEVESLDLAIERSPFESGFRKAPAATPDVLEGIERFAEGAPTPTSTEPPPETASPVDRLRHLRRSLATLEQTLSVRSQELHDVSEKREELRSESERLGLLSASEPADLTRLGELADLLVKALNRRSETDRERTAFEQALRHKGVEPSQLQELESRFTALTDRDREFLGALDQSATIRRGNLALTRSECRLDESQIQEIERARQAGARGAMLPLGLAAIALFAALATSLLHVNGLVSAGLLIAGLAGGGYAGRTFWLARSDREEERLNIVETLDRKRRQIAQLEGEGQESEKELARLAARASDGSVRKLRSDWSRWNDGRSALQDFEAFRQRDHELEEHIAGLRTKLGAFDLGGDPERELDVGRLQSMIEDYQRSFRVRRDLAASDEAAAQLEAGLAPIESERADIRMQIDAMLIGAGIDPTRDLDEAVEMFVLRAPSELSSAAIDPSTPPPIPIAADRPASPVEQPVRPATWMPRIAVAAEALLRCLVPDARDLQVDEHLRWSVRLDARGNRLSPAELERKHSSATVDQVCLALRLAIVETLSSLGERLPVFLDEPWARADDERHARGMQLLVENVGKRGQVVLRTAHEVRIKWFLHQSPALRALLAPIGPPPADPVAAPPSPSASYSPASSGR